MLKKKLLIATSYLLADAVFVSHLLAWSSCYYIIRVNILFYIKPCHHKNLIALQVVDTR